MALSLAPAAIDTPAVYRAQGEVLSIALMDARNQTLQLLSRLGDAPQPARSRALWMAGHIGWFSEHAIARNPGRAKGAAGEGAMRLASIDPGADELFDPRLARAPAEHACAPADLAASLPDADAVRAYLLETLETTLDLLRAAPQDDAGLHAFRLALYQEDLRAEDFAVLAQVQGVPLGLTLPAASAPREPLLLPATRWVLGEAGAGFAPAIERGSDEVAVPEFEIDAQPVSWAQYVEFIDDGSYDRRELWQDGGWQWLQSQADSDGRRGPRFVEQIGVASGAVLQTHFGKAMRMGAQQSAMHVSWWEADAYARWAGRRLPAEVEWEIAAHSAARRGFRWGDLVEWTAGTLRPWPGYRADAWAALAERDPEPAFGKARVLRGASFAARARMKRAKARGWAMPHFDEGFTGFRTCAL